MFQGGGNIPLLMPVFFRLAERGHNIRMIAGPGVRASRLPVSQGFADQISQAGLSRIPFYEPDRHPLDEAGRPRGLVGGWVPSGFRSLPSEAQTAVWAPSWAANVMRELRANPTDLVVGDFVLLGALAATEAARTPSVALMHTVALRPAAGLPPYGPGWLPSRGPVAAVRNALGRALVEHLHRRNGLSVLNEVRGSLGLSPLRSIFDQYDRAARVLMLVPASFDHPAYSLSTNLRHVGTPIKDTTAEPWSPPWPPEDRRPLVLVSLSTLNQGQAPLMRRILRAAGQLNARVLVTLGPALDPAAFEAPENARLERFVPHASVLPHAATMITQCGLGTVVKALSHGVPMLCLPVLGDQPENAARVVARGAGIRLSGDAAPGEIATAIGRLLREPQFREAALAFAAALHTEADPVEAAVNEIEAVASS